MIYDPVDELLVVDGGSDGGGPDDGSDDGSDDEGADGGGDGRVGPRCVCVGLGVGELLCCGLLCGGSVCCRVGAGEGPADAVGLLCAEALFAGPGIAARLRAALLPVPLLLPWPGADLVVEPAPDPLVLRGFAPTRPPDWPGSGVPPTLCVVPGAAAD